MLAVGGRGSRSDESDGRGEAREDVDVASHPHQQRSMIAQVAQRGRPLRILGCEQTHVRAPSDLAGRASPTVHDIGRALFMKKGVTT